MPNLPPTREHAKNSQTNLAVIIVRCRRETGIGGGNIKVTLLPDCWHVTTGFRAARDLDFKTVLLVGEFLAEGKGKYTPQHFMDSLGEDLLPHQLISLYIDEVHAFSCGSVMNYGKGKQYIKEEDISFQEEDLIPSLYSAARGKRVRSIWRPWWPRLMRRVAIPARSSIFRAASRSFLDDCWLILCRQHPREVSRRALLPELIGATTRRPPANELSRWRKPVCASCLLVAATHTAPTFLSVMCSKRRAPRGRTT